LIATHAAINPPLAEWQKLARRNEDGAAFQADRNGQHGRALQLRHPHAANRFLEPADFYALVLATLGKVQSQSPRVRAACPTMCKTPLLLPQHLIM